MKTLFKKMGGLTKNGEALSLAIKKKLKPLIELYCVKDDYNIEEVSLIIDIAEEISIDEVMGCNNATG